VYRLGSVGRLGSLRRRKHAGSGVYRLVSVGGGVTLRGGVERLAGERGVRMGDDGVEDTAGGGGGEVTL
jgi:hypothetical protein